MEAAPSNTRKGSPARPTYVIRLQPLPGTDPIRALRAALKVLLRRFGLKAIEVKEEPRRPAANHDRR